jgi:hypothetical protein
MQNEIACKNQIRNLIKYLDEGKCRWFNKIQGLQVQYISNGEKAPLWQPGVNQWSVRIELSNLLVL